MEIKFTPIKQMITHNPEGGALIEGRATRQGGGSMKIAAYTKEMTISDLRWSTIQVPEVPFPVEQVEYTIKGTTFLPLSTLNDIKRYDTLGFWKLSYQEILRHMGLASTYTESPLWTRMKAIVESTMDEIIDTWLHYLDIVLGGDLSFEHWIYYVTEHAASADPFGIGKWGDLLERPNDLKLAHERSVQWLRNYRADFESICKSADLNLIRANFTYPGVRARPAEYTVLKSGDYDYLVYARKWRDRKVGGIPGLSQGGFGIFNNKYHAMSDQVFTNYAKRTLNLNVHSLIGEGAQMYIDICKQNPVFCYDIKTAEKQVGLLFSKLPMSVDLGHPAFPPAQSPEMYSGIFTTNPANVLYEDVYLKAKQEEGWTGKTIYQFSDNLATDKPLNEDVHVSTSDTFCGMNPANKRFQPVSLCTDNPKHRLPLKNSMHQVQRVQYIMRPFMAVMLNSLDSPDSCMKFMEYVVENKLIDIDDEVKQDSFKDYILAKEPAVHQKILDKFWKTAEYVRHWFVVQETNAERPTDLRWE